MTFGLVLKIEMATHHPYLYFSLLSLIRLNELSCPSLLKEFTNNMYLKVKTCQPGLELKNDPPSGFPTETLTGSDSFRETHTGIHLSRPC